MSAPLRFTRHYAEMVAAMFIGMGVLGMPAMHLADDRPTLELLGMAITMTVPMVAWMRYRGHGWAPCADMTAAMLIPTLGVLAALWTGVVADVGTLMVLEHVVMLPAMLVAMLLRRDEYIGAHHGVAA
jgi:hypothetical protein